MQSLKFSAGKTKIRKTENRNIFLVLKTLVDFFRIFDVDVQVVAVVVVVVVDVVVGVDDFRLPAWRGSCRKACRP